MGSIYKLDCKYTAISAGEHVQELGLFGFQISPGSVQQLFDLMSLMDFWTSVIVPLGFEVSEAPILEIASLRLASRAVTKLRYSALSIGHGHNSSASGESMLPRHLVSVVVATLRTGTVTDGLLYNSFVN